MRWQSIYLLNAINLKILLEGDDLYLPLQSGARDEPSPAFIGSTSHQSKSLRSAQQLTQAQLGARIGIKQARKQASTRGSLPR